MWQRCKSTLVIFITGSVLFGCGGGVFESDDDDDDSKDGYALTYTGDDPSAGRLLLATQCSQCHGTDGYSVSEIDSIAGESYSEILEETVEDADEPEELMGFHGGAYLSLTPELEAVARYTSTR